MTRNSKLIVKTHDKNKTLHDNRQQVHKEPPLNGYYVRKYHENNNPMRIVLSTVNLSLGLHEDTTVCIENYKYTRLQGKKVRIHIV